VDRSFDNLSHRIIMQSVAERVADGNILDLVEKFLTSGVMDGGVFKPTSVGTPQGGVNFSTSGQHRPELSGLAVTPCRLSVCSLRR
jgi:hypothetical protein